MLKSTAGSWQSFSPSDAWKWYGDKQKIEQHGSIAERLNANLGAHNQLYYFDTKTFTKTPQLIDYQQEITKTELDSSLVTERGKA